MHSAWVADSSQTGRIAASYTAARV
jgi:hypothetical protein